MTDIPDRDRGGDSSQHPGQEVRVELFGLSLPVEADALATDIGAAVDTFDASLAVADDPVTAALRFGARMRELEETQADPIGFLTAARSLVAERLIARGHVNQAVEILASIRTGEKACRVIAVLQRDALLRGDLETAKALEAGVMTIFDASAPEKSLGFLREARRVIVEEAPATSSIALDAVNYRLAERIGEDFDPITDWAQAETGRFPEVDIAGLAALMRDDSLWAPDTPVATKLFIAHDVALSVTNIVRSTGVLPKFSAKLIKAVMDKSGDTLKDLPVRSYVDGMIAIAFYRRGSPNEGRTIIRRVDNPGALGYVAESLLRLEQPAVADAQRLALANPDRTITIAILLDGQWPDRSVPDKLLDEITVIQTKRSAGGKGPIPSPHPVDMRIECLRALADRREAEGNMPDATEYRRRADQLAWQLNNGVIKHMPRKG